MSIGASAMVTRDRWLWVRIFAIALLVVISVVSWRRGVLYTGGTDPVVIAKAAIGLTAFALAFLLYGTAREKGIVGTRSLILLGLIVVVSMLGALASGDVSAAAVLSVRILLVAGTVLLLARSAPPMTMLTALIAAIGAVAIFAAVTGVPLVLAGERLAGGIPTMQPNELAGLAGPPAVALAYDFARRGLRIWTSALFLGFVGIIVLTESRTSMLVVAVAIVVALLHARPLPRSTTIALLAAAPVVFAVATLTDFVQQAITRGESLDRLATLNTRTNAWAEVFAIPVDSWAKWIGLGLATKTIAVQDRWRDYQVLDSSWVSAIAQAGVIGTILLAVWVVTTSLDSLRSIPLRALTTPMLTLLLFRSFTENGLIESSTSFMLFLAISLVLEKHTAFPVAQADHRTYRLLEPLPQPSTSGVPSR